MADSDQAAEKTERATPKRRKEARGKGQVAKSQEINSFIILTAGTLIIFSFHGYIVRSILHVFARAFSVSPECVEAGNISNLGWEIFYSFFPIVSPFFIGIVAAGLMANLGQVGFHVTPDVLSPKFDKLNPVNGLKRILSWRSVVEASKGLVKIGIIGFVAYQAIRPAINQILSLSLSSQPDLIGLSLKVGLNIMLRVLVVMVVVAALDYAFQYWQHEKSIRMSLRELRDELKETEGDPLVRERIKSIQREMARRRMMEDVKKADVVLTNPTLLAVALTYNPQLQAPKVVAKGRYHLAERIKKVAREFNVPVMENKPLARALYKACQVGEAVPVTLYQAVAEILAYVYSFKKHGKFRAMKRKNRSPRGSD
ncbi:MAG: flagellar biosynthesis protein FlhB [Candidatus Krumholzibacteriota bacterium]|nr:flagellar biosynthesis protein FlhB [Candidatus Krumholzibacteriota bacterium]